MAELQALRYGLFLAAENDLHSVILESDSLDAISLLKGQKFGHFVTDLLCEDIIQMASQFVHVSFSFTRREGNLVAHCLANGVLEFNSFLFRVGLCPSCCS